MDKMIHAVIADDEALARHKLRQLLVKEPDVAIVGEGASAAQAINAVLANKPSLLFLDIRMPGMDGFDVLGELHNAGHSPMPEIIFTTAYDQYAIRAFEVSAADYLLKPFTYDRLHTAIDRIRARVSHEISDRTPEGQGDHSSTQRIIFKSRGRILFLPVGEIRWIGAEENYVRLSTGADSHLLRGTISDMEARLDPASFLRVHRSFIVNLNYVKEVRSERNGDYAVILLDGQKVAMSRGYKSLILERLYR